MSTRFGLVGWRRAIEKNRRSVNGELCIGSGGRWEMRERINGEDFTLERIVGLGCRVLSNWDLRHRASLVAIGFYLGK